MPNIDDHPVLSKEDVAAVESLYKRITTPLRCRFGLHRWSPWVYVMTTQFGAMQLNTGRKSFMVEMDLSMRLCPHCVKVQTRAATRKTEVLTPDVTLEDNEC